MSKVHVSINGAKLTSMDLPSDIDPLAHIARNIEADLGRYSGEDTELDRGTEVEYTYNEWTITVERKEL